MKKNILFITVILMLTLLISGCGDKSNNISYDNDTQKNNELQQGSQTDDKTTLEKITFVLDWVPNTNHTGIYAAKVKGYYEDEGLDVEIIQPGETGGDQMVVSNIAQFGVSYQESVTFARAAKMPLVSIAAVIQHNTSGFASLKEKNITSAKNFEGKKYGGWGSDIEEAMVKYIAQNAGADPEKVEILTTGTADFFQSSETNQIDFAWVYEGWDVINAKIKGIELNYIDLGKQSEIFDYYTPVIVTNEDNIANNKELVQKFMRATIKGYDYAIKNPEDAADCLLALAPELDKQLVVESQKFLADKYKDDASKWGIQKDAVWQRYTDWLFENGFIDDKIDVSKAFTNEFIE